MKNIVTFTRFVTLAAVAALALTVTPIAARADGHDWTGAYAGANVGAGMSSGNIDDPDCFSCTAAAFSERLLQGGINGGYNKQFGASVLGAEAEINWGSQNHRNSVGQDNSGGSNQQVVSRVDWTAALMGKAGVAVGDGLFYVTAGPAVARASGNADGLNSGTRYDAAYSNWQPAFKAGFGAEFMVSHNVSVRLQYSTLTIADRTAYGTQSSTTAGRTIWTNTQSVATVGAAWHF